MNAAALVADRRTQVSNRLVPEEPMVRVFLSWHGECLGLINPAVLQSIVLSLAMSQALATVDPTELTFPAEFKIDYVRVYQRQGAKNVGCDPTGELMWQIKGRRLTPGTL